MRCGKRVYPNQPTAERKIARALSGIDNWHGRPLPVRSYSCFMCHAWHITSKPFMSQEELHQMAQKKELA